MRTQEYRSIRELRSNRNFSNGLMPALKDKRKMSRLDADNFCRSLEDAKSKRFRIRMRQALSLPVGKANCSFFISSK